MDTENPSTDHEDGVSVDSGMSMNNTPKQKKLGISKDAETEKPEVKATNNAVMMYPQPNVVYKYFIGKGNNSIMVRSLFKNRFWWLQHDT